MNPVVMHIGLTKTGTSSPQAALSAHRDELAGIGFVYPLSGRPNRPRVGERTHEEQSDERLAAASTSFRNAGPFADPEPGEFRDHVALELLGDDVFDDEERRFVVRMEREIMKSATTPVEATR